MHCLKENLVADNAGPTQSGLGRLSNWREPHRIPTSLYTDPAVYARELERIFYGRHWCYVALEAEVPSPGDFKTTFIGERSVIVTRDPHGEIHVLENRCRHKGIRLVQASFGNVGESRRIVCPYHQWCYKLNGSLTGVPYRRGVQGHGGYPSDFSLKEHGLERLKVSRYQGLVFASFDADVESFTDYLGPAVEPYVRRTFHDAPLRLLGFNRQRIRGNWKLMQENIKDPYHPALLHAFFVTFGLWRPDQKSRMVMDSRGRHACMISTRNQGGANAEVTAGVTSFKQGLKLADPSILDVVNEDWWGDHTVVMQTIFPSVIIQQQVNSLSTRQIIPVGPDSFDFVWTHFGFAGDDERMTARRLLQANLFGPAGFVSLEDGEVIEFSQHAHHGYPDRESLAELGGRETEPAEHMVTETLIRSMYKYYQEVMAP
jgi:salicylate 5-hydroxylase large subunit